MWSLLLWISSALQVSWQRWRGLLGGRQRTASSIQGQYVLVLISALVLISKPINLWSSGNHRCPWKCLSSCTELDWMPVLHGGGKASAGGRLFSSLWDVYAQEGTHVKWVPSKVLGVLGNTSVGCDLGKGESGEDGPCLAEGALL